MTATAERLWALIGPYVAEEGIELDDIEIVGSGGASIVRVIIDDEGPLDVDLIARISRGVSRLLDSEDPISSSYTLEVSSPGLERKLRRPRHYEKSIGREAKLKTRSPIDGERHHRGMIVGAGETEVTLETEQGSRVIPLEEVTSARTVFVWDAKAKPGAVKH